MPTDEFEENRNFLKPAQSEGIDEDAFKSFSQQYGPDVVKGYKMAAADILPFIERLWNAPGDAGKRRAAFALHDYLEGILHSDSGFDESNSNPSIISPLLS